MNAIRAITNNFERLGYQREALIPDYTYPDLMLKEPVNRTVALAAFTRVPTDYRTAAFAVVPVEPGHEKEAAKQHRALGAPLLMCYSDDRVSVWQITSTDSPRKLDEATLENVDQLFARYTKEWHPDRIHRAKSIGKLDRYYQLDFIDAGLLPAIEGQIHLKLDRVLQDVLEALSKNGRARGTGLNERQQFHFAFRLLAAKVLQDRQHAFATRWDSGDVQSVLNGILDYYNLKRLQETSGITNFESVGRAWDILKGAISFRNLSADDMAFVYENTLVTGEFRQKYGIHSTPRPVAEYVVANIRFTDFDPQQTYLYEPFSGAAPFLITALKYMRGLLPSDWNAERCHEYLVKHVWAHEFDDFACDVAMLSLILADYPNKNGWHVESTDLFKGTVLRDNLAKASIALCNPPYEDFSPTEKLEYPDYSARSVHKPIAVLEAALDQNLQALGFVLPFGLIDHVKYADVRARIEKSFSDIKMVSLPDNVFQHSDVPCALLMAQRRRSEKQVSQTTHLISSEVAIKGRRAFLSKGDVNSERELTKPYIPAQAGDIWVKPLDRVWSYLATNKKLEEYATNGRGLEWNYEQAQAHSPTRRQGFSKGLATRKGMLYQFGVSGSEYLDTRPEKQRGNAYLRAWHKPKIIASGARVSRGPWRFAAAIDDTGLYASQQFIGIWLKEHSQFSLEEITAILNGPVGNAYMAVHDIDKRFRLFILDALPMPRRNLGKGFEALYAEYKAILAEEDIIRASDRDTRLEACLKRIDAEVLAAYDLPSKVEKELLNYFRGAERPVVHEFGDWIPAEFGPAISLKDYLETDMDKMRGQWVLEVFKPLPDDEAEALREALG